MNLPHEASDVEFLARVLAEARWGKDTWLNGKINRTYWRAKAKTTLAAGQKVRRRCPTALMDRESE